MESQDTCDLAMLTFISPQRKRLSRRHLAWGPIRIRGRGESQIHLMAKSWHFLTNQRPFTREKCLTRLGQLLEFNSLKRVCHYPLHPLIPAAGLGGPGFSLRAWASRIQPVGEGCWADENVPDQWEEENAMRLVERGPCVVIIYWALILKHFVLKSPKCIFIFEHSVFL